jgi:transcriptional regulator with XRE-family HTH domain
VARPTPFPTAAIHPHAGRKQRSAATRRRDSTLGGPAPENRGTVGELIRSYRLMAGLTQEELGERADLSVRAVRDLERDKVRRPRRDTLTRLVPALGLNNADTARLVAAVRTARPARRAAAAAPDAAPPRAEFNLWSVLDQVIEQLGPDRVLMVPVLVTCPTLCGCMEE